VRIPSTAAGHDRRGAGGQEVRVRVTFRALIDTSGAAHPSDRFERDTIEILKRISRRPIEPTLDSELLADLGFDSLQVLELVGELEEHFNIAVPLNDLSRIRTVSQVVAEARALAGGGQAA
jgi:acyl carrier protein